jgi:lipopolysaccharide biosynthesis glycosyltransferase
VLEDEVVDSGEMGIIWQRYFLFDILDHNEIKADQILIVDADTIVHPDCPDFFTMTENKYTLVADDGDFDWILRSMENYHKHLFPNEPFFDWFEYYNSGFQIVNQTHRPFFNAMRKFYEENANTIRYCQSHYGVGTDQTPLNFMLRREKIERKQLPYPFNMSCMFKKEVLSDNMLHTKAGYVMHFNGLQDKKTSVPYWMGLTYDFLYGKVS